MNENTTRDPNVDPIFFSSTSDSFIKLMTERMGRPLIKSIEVFSLLDDALNNCPKENADYMSVLVGCYVGEFLKEIFVGKWYWSVSQERWVILLQDKNNESIELNVFRKIKNRICNGEEDSLAYWYTMTKNMIENGIDSVLQK